jgi:hypothetical protein
MNNNCLLFFLLLLFCHKVVAQESKLDSLFASNADSTTVIDSLMAGFDDYLDSALAPKSFFSASLALGNRTFSLQNNALNTQSTATGLSYTPAVGYYHKTGIGISATAFITDVNKKIQPYQHSLTPSFDMIGNKFSTGISYTRYFAKDTSIGNTTPYTNDWYTYFTIRKKSWRFSISLGYANGSFEDKIKYKDSIRVYDTALQKIVWRRYTATVKSANDLQDFSFSLSARKSFEWEEVLAKEDNLLLTFAGYLVAGSSHISTTGNINYQSKKIQLTRFRRKFDNTDGTGFQFQSTSLSTSLLYTIGKFNIQPIWYVEYYFPDTDNHFNQVFSLALGITF